MRKCCLRRYESAKFSPTMPILFRYRYWGDFTDTGCIFTQFTTEVIKFRTSYSPLFFDGNLPNPRRHEREYALYANCVGTNFTYRYHHVGTRAFDRNDDPFKYLDTLPGFFFDLTLGFTSNFFLLDELVVYADRIAHVERDLLCLFAFTLSPNN